MKLSKNIALSCEILAAHKLRTLLSVTGIVVGIATDGKTPAAARVMAVSRARVARHAPTAAAAVVARMKGG